MDTILNTTILSNFASVDALNLIKRLFGVVYTTHEVHEEILRGISRGYQYLEDVDHEMSFDGTGWLRVIAICSHTEHQSMKDLLKRLGLGESSCIAIAKSRKMIFIPECLPKNKVAKLADVTPHPGHSCDSFICAIRDPLCRFYHECDEYREL